VARILVAESDPLARRFLRSALELGDHHVTEVDNGDQAVLEMTRRQFDVVITEHRLPRVSGVDVVWAASRLDPHASCLVLAGHGDHDALVPALEAGAVGLIPKPATVREVLLLVARAHERRLLAVEAARARRVTGLLESWVRRPVEAVGGEAPPRAGLLPEATRC